MTEPTFEWIIERIDETGSPPWVCTVHWRLEATDSSTGVKAETYGTVELPPPGPQPLPFESLTVQLVGSWVRQAINDRAKTVDEGEAEPSVDDLHNTLRSMLAARTAAPPVRALPSTPQQDPFS